MDTIDATSGVQEIIGQKRMREEEEGDVLLTSKVLQKWMDPVQGLASMRRVFGEYGGVNMSIEASTTFTVMEPETMTRLIQGVFGRDSDFYIYSRQTNPTVLNLSRQMAAMEGTEAAYCTSSGMAAITSVLMQLCSSSDHVVASNRLYGGTYAFLSHFLPRSSNITTTFVDVGDFRSVRDAIKSSTKVLYFESVSNPQLSVANIPVLAGIAHEKGVTVVVDNTFSPIIISPARHGADVVVHSLTKFISGSSDIIAGAICGSLDLVSSMMSSQQGALMLLGPTMNPHVAFDLAMRLPHLELRMKEHCSRALLYSRRLKKLGMDVIYPGLEEHPQHGLMKELVNEGCGFGGMLCLDLKTTEKAHNLMRHLQNVTQFGLIAVSLGYHDTLMSCSGSSTSNELSQEEQDSAGISAGLVRMSIGFTGYAEKRWSQFEDALKALKLVPNSANGKN